MQGPQSLGTTTLISLTDSLFPVLGTDAQGRIAPVFIEFNGTAQRYFPVFSTIDKLHALMQHIGIRNYKIKRIEDHAGFLDSVMQAGEVIAYDAYVHDNDKVRFTRIPAPEDVAPDVGGETSPPPSD